ncbi:TPA: hypothetical protein N0F65_000007 [Lagenidium giganteum]|uniref:Transmembrane protein n=1 Tax=Lagenidium giganteum TaxID=4803 RepID=A0AAV2YN30_9STRA|nr:TPA: hypothetical protein N0F65_000007 [Lagenidium giganteum]
MGMNKYKVGSSEGSKKVVGAASGASAGGNTRGGSARSVNRSCNTSKKNKITPHIVLNLVRRVAILGAAVLYLVTAIRASIDAIKVLRGDENPPMVFLPYESKLMAKYAGTTTLRESPMMKALNYDTTPRNDSLYLMEDSTSFDNCSSTPLPDRIYYTEFQRFIYASLVGGASYNLMFLDPAVGEMIVPVVDCTFSSILNGDNTAVRFFYLIRMQSNHDDITFINDVQVKPVQHYFALSLGYPFEAPRFQVYELLETTSESFWSLKSIPPNPLTEVPKYVLTACRTGFYLSSEAEQSNIKNLLWALQPAALDTNAVWKWEGNLYDGNMISQAQGLFIYPDIMRADLMSVYLSGAGILGTLLRERVDPAFAIIMFEIGYGYRWSIQTRFPGLLKTVTDFANFDFGLGMAEADPNLSLVTPLRLWTIHQLPSRDPNFIFANLFPIFSTFVFIVIYVIVRKIYRHFNPDKLHIQRVTGYSEDEESLLAQKRTLTLFELATGAALQNRYGLVSDYENCLFIKGMKFASADGIYCNGFVIANGKFLIATVDLTAILLMKLTRIRYRNIYVYDVNGNTVQQTARLVYPTTITFSDLLRLNITVLS